MSSRFPPVHESRYPPRARSRSPPRYEGWRPNGPPNPGFNNNNNNNRHGDFGRGLDPPRGPRTFNDSPRGPPPGPGTGSSAPLGPRGRGAPIRTEFRELRDAPPLGTDRSFRERELDRRPRPTSPRPRSPVRGFRDGPIPPRDLDLGRGRRDSRDGPISAGPGYSDAPPFGQPPFGRGGFNSRGRGRGRGDFGFRGDRRGPVDDRNTFRPRDRSPPPTRWGSVSRGDRDDWRPERREDDRWLDRDDREREPDRFRRDPIASRFDSRPPTPHQQAPSAQPPADRAPPFESSRDDLAMRRPSTTSLSGVKEPLRRDLPPQNAPPPMPLPPNDLLAGRVESSAARYGSRASSPPPSAPQVPAFGSLSFKPQPYSGPTSNVWKASPENRAPATPAKPLISSPPAVKIIPTAPKAQLAAPPPAAPRAPRALENAPPTAPRETLLDRAPSVPNSRISSAPQPPAPTGPWALRTDDRSDGQFGPATTLQGRRLSGSFQPDMNNAPTSPRTSGPPVAQMAQMTPLKPLESLSNQMPNSQTQPGPGTAQDGRAPRPDMAPPRLGTPPPTAPSGPRNTHTFSTSPVMQNPNIPTAPKAIRGPPMAPRASLDRGQPPHRPMERNGLAPPRVPPGAPRASAWNQWIRPGAPQYREPSVPAKRDSNGDEKTKQFMPRTSPQTMNRQVSDPSSMRVEEVKNDRAFRTAPVSPERRLSDANAVNNPPFQREYSVPSPAKKPESDPAVDVDVATAESSEDSFSDEEGMDLDEQDFAQSKAKFERQRAHLASQMINLNARQYRATTPLAQISRLANITVQDLPPAPSSTIAEINDDVMEGMETSDVPARAASPLHPLSPTPRKDAPTDLIIPKKEQIEEPETVTIPPVHTTYKQPEPDRVLESAEVDQDEDIDMDGSEDLDFITPEPKRNIEATITLPFLAKTPLTPLSDLGAFHENIARLNAAKPALIMHYQAQAEEEQIVQKDLQEEYVEKYRAWKLETQLLDRERASKETEERQMSVELGLDIESSPIMENPISESSRSRLHKFSSEYDIQQVLKQSEETARLEQEKSDRESRRAQIDLEKEAIAPDMWDEASKEKRIFKNMNRFRDPICLTDIYGYEPEFESFTEAEDKRFVELFKERPKQWGEIAAQLPGRSYTDCIHHYYKYKWDGRFKEKQKRKAKGGARRGGKTGRAKPATLMSDLRKDGEEDSSSGPMLTETGRPRRAATRTAYTAEKEPEVKPVAGAATVNKKVPAPGEVVPEKPAKRRKTTAAGDKPQKRGRQTLVSTATSVTSPAGTEKEVILSQEDFARAKQLEEAALLTGIYTGTRALGGPQHVEYAHDPLPIQVTNDAVERTRAPAQTSMQRSSASSYWSVPEQTDFVKFIAHFGTDFGAIANHMGTKTQTMVKNYYQRLVESGNRPDVVDAANGANARRDRGEDMGIPPTPTPINKRRYDNPGPTLPRTASGSQGEVMDIDPIPSTQPSSLAQPSSQFQHQYRFSMNTQPTSAPPQRAAPTPLQPHGSPALGKSGLPTQPRASISSSSGPKMGFFSESRMERRPTLPGSERTAQQPSPSLMHQQQPTPPGLMHQNLSHLTSEFVKNLKEEQERALSIQKRASQEHVPQVVQHSMFQPPAAQTSAPTGSPQLSMLERPLERDERAGTPGVPTLAHPRAGPGMFRNILGSPGPIQSPAVNMHPPFRSAHVPSPPKREEQPMYRPGSVPVPSPATSVVKPAGSLASGPPAEPRKTSNLASLLNSEPEEPRQKKRIGEQATPFAQSPTPSTLSVGPSGPGSSIFARRDVFNQTPVSRQEYDGRSSYSQPTSHAPTPAAQHDLMTGRSGTPVGSRQPEWQSRPPMGHNVTSSSPHPPAPLERDVRPYYSHRANLGSLNPQSRANPSPPPNTHPYMNHSRTPSVSGRPMTPSQLQPQGPSGLSHMTQAQPTHAQSQIMQSNPYPQQHGGPSHMQQIQAHQQNQFSHRHNSSGGSSHSGLHQRQTSRGEEMTMLRQQQQQQQQQEREFHMSREREHRMEVDRQYKEREAQFHQHQQQQEQQRYTQHRTPQPFQQQSLSGPPPQILSMREQARIEADQSYRDARNREQYEQEMHIRRIQEDEERMRYDYRNPNGMIGRNSGGGYGGGGAGFPPPGPHRR